MKHLLLSVDGVIDSKKETTFPKIVNTLENFKDQNQEREVVIISARGGKRLNLIPRSLNPTKIPYELRGSGDKLIRHLNNKLGKELDDIIVIGAKSEDMRTAKHLRAILLRADYAQQNNELDDIFTNDYGIPLRDVTSITSFFDSFTAVENPWYFRIKVDEDTTLLALTSANTFSVHDNRTIKIMEEFRGYLKEHKKEFVLPFSCYFIVAAHLMIRELEDFHYWDIYPSSSKGVVNDDLLYFARKASHTFGKKFHLERLFIRTETAFTRHRMSSQNRLSNGCDEQFRTMIINPYYADKLKDKNVCVIDDFTRHGTSCETARLMLKQAGVNKMLFIAMGKFGTQADYNKYEYDIKGDVFSRLSFTQKRRSIEYGSLNNKANKDFIKSLGKWI